jgi:UPF0755 protein
MVWHDVHFPTFKRTGHDLARWWKGLDRFEHFLAYAVLGLACTVLFYWYLLAPPYGFPSGAYIDIPEGSSLSSIAELMQSRGIVSYSVVLKEMARILGANRSIQAGEYYFPGPQNAAEIAFRLAHSDFDTTPIKVTVPEGATVNDVANLLAEKLPGFNKSAFLNATQGQEGYLFPDTYFFLPGEGTQTILTVFSNDFQEHMLEVQPQITAFGKPLPEVLTMASIVEKEAPDLRDRQIIAGILWHRIKIGMPLQVDVTFPYFLDKNADDLTTADLGVDSPYNTFLNTGLPPGPVDNPSLSSILAAVTPVQTSYLYYLSDSTGTMHYATTYKQFLTYKQEYLGS